jgi:hypothetical protein
LADQSGGSNVETKPSCRYSVNLLQKSIPRDGLVTFVNADGADLSFLIEKGDRRHEELARADEQPARGLDAPRQPSFSQTGANSWGSVSWARRGFAGLLLAVCIAVAAIVWRQPSRDKTATSVSPQPAVQAQTSPKHAAPRPNGA